MKNWLKYTRWLESRLPVYYDLLRPGASEADINALEEKVSFNLPDQFQELYRINDGDEKRAKGRIPRFLPGIRIPEPGRNRRGMGLMEGRIRQRPHRFDEIQSPKDISSTSTRIRDGSPCSQTTEGNYIGLDLNPGSKGRIGQVINFGRDEWKKFVIAEKLKGFLAFIVEQMEKGVLDASIVQEDEIEFSYGLSPQSHLIDDLKSVLVY